MKNLFIALIFISLSPVYGQNLNWNSNINDHPNIGYTSIGYDFALAGRLGYGHYFGKKLPFILQGDISIPFGRTLLDDFTSRLGGQIQLWDNEKFRLSSGLYGLLQRHQTKWVRMLNLGTEIEFKFGYYQPKWYLSLNAGYFGAFTTNLKHSGDIKQNYLDISDGWYRETGGHFFYGIQWGKSLNQLLDLNISLGATNALSKHTNATVPYSFQLGLNWKFAQVKQ